MIEKGVKRVLFNCHYIIKNFELVQECAGHFHHIHFDGLGAAGYGPQGAARHTTCYGCNSQYFAVCDQKIVKIKNGSGQWVDYNRNTQYITDNISRGPGAVKLTKAKTQAEWDEMQNQDS